MSLAVRETAHYDSDESNPRSWPSSYGLAATLWCVIVLLLIVYPGLLLGVPGYLASRWIWPVASPLQRTATSLGLGVATVVPTAYVLPFILRTPFSMLWSIGASLVVSLAFAAALYRGGGQARAAQTAKPAYAASESAGMAVFLLLCCALSAMTTLPRWFEATNLWAPCPHQAAMYLMDAGGFGLRAYDPAWGGYVSHLLERGLEPAFGLQPVLERQRIGSAATLVHSFLFHGSGGLVVAAFLYTALNVLTAAALMARFIPHAWLLGSLSLCTLAALRYAAFYMVNESALAAGLAALSLYLLTDSETSHRDRAVVAAGAALALAIATRPYAITLLPAALWFIGLRPARVVRFAFVVLVALFPWALTQAEAFGSPFHHPSLIHANTQIEVFGFTFAFHPLNYPFADSLLRPEASPLPNLFLVPFETLQGFGAIFAVTAITGLFALPWRIALGLLAWGMPTALLLMSIVWLDHDKLSYILLAYAPLYLLAAAGTRALTDGIYGMTRSKRLDSMHTSRRAVLSVGVGLCVVFGLPYIARGVSFQVDPRVQYHDGPDRWAEVNSPERLEAMSSIPLLPNIGEPNHLLWAFDHSLDLLTHARPVKRGDEISEDPLLFWAELLPLDIQVRARIHSSVRLPSYAIDPSMALGPVTEDDLAVSIQVPGPGDAAQVQFRRAAGDLHVHVDGPSSGDMGYITLGLIASGSDGLSDISIPVNGQVQALEYHLVSAPEGGDKRLRAIANHRLGYVADQGALRFETNTPVISQCAALDDHPEILIGTNIAQTPDLRVWRSQQWPPDRPPECRPK
ncbi:MAG: hypothetical protein VX223_06740 [Myxococcota bacterium]|nr:hypothetical protein [Myxococcota bacterium]